MLDNTIRSFKLLRLACKLAPLAIVIVFLGEGLQHFVEVKLGMFENRDAFVANMKGTLRLGFGGIKALCVLLAALLISMALNAEFKIFPRQELFKKLLFFSPNHVIGYLISLLALCGPLIWFHMNLNSLAIGHDLFVPILIFDSLVVSAIGLVLGVTYWVGLVKPPPSNVPLAPGRN